MLASILVVVRDPAERQRLARVLEGAGYDPIEVASQSEVELDAPPTLVLVEADQRDEVDTTAPVLVLGGTGDPTDARLPRPFTRNQLLGAVSASVGLRRPTLQLGDREVDLEAREVRVGGVCTALTLREADLLAVLAERVGQVVPSEELVARVWGHAGPSTLSVTVRRLRTKIEPDPAHPSALRTVHGVGLELHLHTPAPRMTAVPAAPTSLVGRQTELDALLELGGPGLATVLGPGGVGKTRLAVELARRVGESADVLWVDLEEVHGVTGVCGAVARAMQIPLPDIDPVAQLARVWANQRWQLVVLDNVETVLEATATCLSRWSGPLFVATSRVPLGLPGERRVILGPLAPDHGLQLLRALAPTLGDDPRLPEVVAALDGLPLAIELAAPVAAGLGADALLQGSLLELLHSDGPGRPQRHADLRAALRWSWERLSDVEQQALTQLAGAALSLGGPAAQHVLAPHPLSVLQRLVTASLVHVAAGPRYRVLATVRAFVLESGPPDARLVGRAALRSWSLVQAGDLAKRAGDDPAAMRDLAELAEALELSLRTAAEDGDGQTALKLVRALHPWLRAMGGRALHRELVDLALATPGGTDVDRAHGLLMVVALTLPAPAEATPPLQAAREHVDRAGDPDLLALWEGRAADVAWYGRDPDRAHSLLVGALERCGDRPSAPIGDLRFRLGHWHVMAGAPDTAEAFLLESADLLMRRGDRWNHLHVLLLLSTLLERTGRAGEASRIGREALRRARELDDLDTLGRLLCNLGGGAAVSGRTRAAHRYLLESLEIRRHTGYRYGEALVLGNLGELHALRGEFDRADAAIEEARALMTALHDRRGEATCRVNMASLRHRAGRQIEAAHLLDGAIPDLQALGQTRVVGAARLHRAEVYRATGHPHEATRQLALARALLVPLRDTRMLCLLDELELSWGDGSAPSRAAAAAELIARARAAGSTRATLRAHDLLARALADAGRVDDARAAVERARALLEETDDPSAAARVDVADAWVALASGDPSGAQVVLATPPGDLRVADAALWSTEVQDARQALATRLSDTL